jgi:hypothetical protein
MSFNNFLEEGQLFKIVDNFLPEAVASKIASTLESNEFPVYLQKSVSYESGSDPFYFFGHVVFNHGQPISWFYNTVAEPVLNILNPNKVLRVRVNMYPREKEITTHAFHVDNNLEPYFVALWYANSNNGKTILKVNGKEETVDSVYNRMLFFDGTLVHAPTTHTDTKVRVTLNINIAKV